MTEILQEELNPNRLPYKKTFFIMFFWSATYMFISSVNIGSSNFAPAIGNFCYIYTICFSWRKCLELKLQILTDFDVCSIKTYAKLLLSFRFGVNRASILLFQRSFGYLTALPINIRKFFCSLYLGYDPRFTSTV